MSFRTNTSVVWDYFTKDRVSKKALCSICNELYCYQSTTANLKGHLCRKHPNVYKQFELKQAIRQLQNEQQDATVGDDDSNSSVEIPAEVWNFFERDTESDPGRARCVICNATVSLLDMMEHMKSEHPKVNTKTEFLTEEFEVEEDALNNSKEKDAFDTEIVYVQDNSGYKKKLPPKRRQSRNFNVDRKRLSKLLHEEEEEADDVQLKLKKAKYIETDDDEIDKFTTYVTCLLKQLPKDVCAKLQMDIINLIMTAKLKIPQQSATEMLKTSSNMITVTSVDGTYMLVPPSVEKNVTLPTSEPSERRNESGRTDPTSDS